MQSRRTSHCFLKVLVAVMLTALFTGAAWAGNLFSKPFNSPAGHWPWALAAGDFNQDGIIDIAITGNIDGNIGQVRVLLGNGRGAFQKPAKYKAGQSPFSIAAGDLNGDGKLDLMVANPSAPGAGNLSLFFGNGDGTFQRQVKRGDTKHAAFNVVAGDFNGDGKLDLAFTNERTRHQNGLVSILLGNGDGTFQAPIKTETSKNPRNLVAGDLNGDGKLDLIVADTKGGRVGGTFVLLGNGDGTFRVSLLEQSASPSIALGDFNEDGIPDFAETSGLTKVAIHLGNGDGTFKQPRHFTAGNELGLMTIADFDQDGRLDVVVTDYNKGSVVEFLPGKGDGRLDAPTSYPLNSGTNLGQIISADVNGDGKPDVILTDYSHQCVTVLLNKNR